MAAKPTAKKKTARGNPAGETAPAKRDSPRKKTTKKTPGPTKAAKTGVASTKRGGTKAKVATKKKTRSTRGKAGKAGSEKARKATVSAAEVNLVHIFSLRPRVNTAFRPEDFRTAKHRLRDERYVSLEAAARAVVEQAHALSREDQPRFAAKRT